VEPGQDRNQFRGNIIDVQAEGCGQELMERQVQVYLSTTMQNDEGRDPDAREGTKLEECEKTCQDL